MYTLNRDHVLADGVISMAAAMARLRQRLRDRLAGWDVPCVHASLFGSAARGDGETHSDIDVLVVRPADVAGDDPTWQGQLAQLEEDVARWTGTTPLVVRDDRGGSPGSDTAPRTRCPVMAR